MKAVPLKTAAPDYPWAEYSDEALLGLRFCDLRLKIAGSDLEPLIARFYVELKEAGVAFLPKVYLGDEWFSPEGVPAIAVPFYLAHSRLKALEQKMMLEVEGGTKSWCTRLLRHEAGHCFDHAYGVSRTKKWREIFGSPDEEYDPDSSLIRPYSRSFVRNIDDGYAQSHPDEDFAETFAVWLDPESDWRNRYRDWKGALRKLEYVDSLVKKYSKSPLERSSGPRPCQVNRLKSTLKKHYERRKKEYAESFPDFYDRDLKKIFDGDDQGKKDLRAAVFFKAK